MLLAYFLNELGTWFGYVALAIGVYGHTGNAYAVAGLFVARGLLPALLAPVLVVRMERISRRGSLAALYVTQGLLTLGLAALIFHFSLPGVLVLVALDGIGAIATAALVRTIAAHIAEREEGGEAAQRHAYASLNIAFMVAFAIGPAIGGALVHLIGGPLALVADAASFLLCASILLDFRTDIGSEAGGSIRSQLADAWHHVQGLRILRTLLVTQAVSLVFFASVEPIEVIYAKHTLSSGAFGLGLLLGTWGLGAALGAILYARALKRSLGAMLTLGALLVGVAYLGFAAAPTIALACIAAAIGGIGNGIEWPALVSSVQRLTPSEMQGRLMGALGAMGTLFPSLGFALGGAIAALSSTRIAMLVAGVVTCLATLAFARVALNLRATEPEQAGTLIDQAESPIAGEPIGR